MKITNMEMRAVIERVSKIEIGSQNNKKYIVVFEYLDAKGIPSEYKIQNVNNEDITDLFTPLEGKKITDALYKHYTYNCR